ncbi:MAG: acyl-CoA dehydrogenase, partial [Desulfobacula sp.]|nr:acyl-CoA dehydrogenase [Desulfobacula sp.]
VFGGYGFTKEYPQEQLLRDCKITQIYEGTNGIQAMDLLARKLSLNKGRSFKDLLDEIRKTIDTAREISSLKSFALSLDKTLIKLREVAQNLGETVRSENIMNAFANAHPFLDVTGDTIMAWMLLWRAVLATQKLEQKPKKKDLEFYEGQLKSAQFFINTVLPVSRGKMDMILSNDTAVVDISEAAFGGK